MFNHAFTSGRRTHQHEVRLRIELDKVLVLIFAFSILLCINTLPRRYTCTPASFPSMITTLLSYYFMLQLNRLTLHNCTLPSPLLRDLLIELDWVLLGAQVAKQTIVGVILRVTGQSGITCRALKQPQNRAWGVEVHRRWAWSENPEEKLRTSAANRATCIRKSSVSRPRDLSAVALASIDQSTYWCSPQSPQVLSCSQCSLASV